MTDPAKTWIDAAEVVIIGGGVIGCSIAYCCAKAGLNDVLVVERNGIAAAATARAAGVIVLWQADANEIGMARQTLALIPELEHELGAPLDFHNTGELSVAFTEASEARLAKQETALAAAGVQVENLSPTAAHALCPWLDTSRARRASLLPEGGYIDGTRIAMAYAKAARARGVRFLTGVNAEKILADGSRVIGVQTSRGAVRARNVVVASGAWSPVLSRSIGCFVAAAPTRSHYWITAPYDSENVKQPVVTLPDYSAYLHPEVGGLLVGTRETTSATFDPFTLPPDMESVPLFDGVVEQDFLIEQVAPLQDVAPMVAQWKFAHHIAGLSMYTPDGKYLIGGFPGLEGFILATGFCGSGIGASGGAGSLVTDLILGRSSPISAEPFRPDRFGRVDPGAAEFRARCAAARAVKGRSGQIVTAISEMSHR